jgi:hypothetical protein
MLGSQELQLAAVVAWLSPRAPRDQPLWKTKKKMPPAFEVSLSIGDTTVHLVSEDRRLAPAVDGLLRQFVTDNRRADVEISARWTDTPDEPGGEMIFDCGLPWQLARLGDEFVFTFRSAIGGAAPYKTARFNATFTSGDVRVYRPHFDRQLCDTVDPLEYPLDELLMIHVLSQGRGVEVHGCALVDGAGRAYVFAGQSGAGKSTLARLWVDHPGVKLLSDERIVLRTDRDPIVVYGTPWHGDALLASPLSGDLAGVFFLNHAPRNTVRPVIGSQALAKLLSCSFLPFHGAEPVNHTVTALERVVSQTPCYQLGFTPDASVIETLEPYLSGSNTFASR